MTTTLLDHLIIEPEEVYAARRADHLSSHALAEFRRNPRLFRDKELGLVHEPERAAFLIGRAVHCRVLEGTDAFAGRFAIGGPINPKTGKPYGQDTKAYAEWATALGKPAISQDTTNLAEQLAGAVDAHPAARALLDTGRAEGVVRTRFHDLPCQGRLDWVHPELGLVDLKTIDDLDWFEHQARSFGYAHQLAFYRDLLRQVSGIAVQVHVIAVEKKPCYRVGVWRFSEQVLDQASRENRAAMQRLKICRRQDRWPTGYEDTRHFDYL
ncbi:MAG: PD-(D/E)XK nuclease-like domain-containing protein [Planctomycetota bacterium]